ncbi:MAG: phosphatidylglycerophosphatase A [Minwuia sp.]|uniref:phosphatidylglycerophosphatase A family protein n=1 Tax=Minwuia sp. TaxID=2493630 RepID=UPI003A8A8DC1
MINRVATFVATWGWTGFIRPAPGTWGTVAGVPAGWAILEYGGRSWLAAGVVLAFLIGWWAAHRHMKRVRNQNDPSEVVIDEVAGLWTTYLAAPDAGWVWLLAGFLLFRLFDIWKAGPVGWADRRVKGALGTMIDDIIAGILAAICLLLIHWLWSLF